MRAPVSTAIWTAPTFKSADLRDHLTQWPKLVAIALEEGIAGILAFRLFVAEDTLGALDLYSYTAGAFDDSTRAVGMIFAAHASAPRWPVRRSMQKTSRSSRRFERLWQPAM